MSIINARKYISESYSSEEITQLEHLIDRIDTDVSILTLQIFKSNREAINLLFNLCRLGNCLIWLKGSPVYTADFNEVDAIIQLMFPNIIIKRFYGTGLFINLNNEEESTWLWLLLIDHNVKITYYQSAKDELGIW